MAFIVDYVKLNQNSLWLSAASIAFNPFFWNTVARQEYRSKTISKIFGGNARYGCYAVAVAVFSLGIFRDALYERALRHQPVYPPLAESPLVKPFALLLFLCGNTLVLTSMYALGITGTFLGDYFGILKDDMVTGFPFNVSSCPMYVGSTMNFVAVALWFGKPAGFLLSLELWVAYSIALQYEDPFTAEIYAKRERERKKGKKSIN